MEVPSGAWPVVSRLGDDVCWGPAGQQQAPPPSTAAIIRQKYRLADVIESVSHFHEGWFVFGFDHIGGITLIRQTSTKCRLKILLNDLRWVPSHVASTGCVLCVGSIPKHTVTLLGSWFPASSSKGRKSLESPWTVWPVVNTQSGRLSKCTCWPYVWFSFTPG